MGASRRKQKAGKPLCQPVFASKCSTLRAKDLSPSTASQSRLPAMLRETPPTLPSRWESRSKRRTVRPNHRDFINYDHCEISRFFEKEPITRDPAWAPGIRLRQNRRNAEWSSHRKGEQHVLFAPKLLHHQSRNSPLAIGRTVCSRVSGFPVTKTTENPMIPRLKFRFL